MQEEMMVSRSIYIPASLQEALERLAKEDSRNFSNYVRIVLEDHIAKAEAKAAKEARKATPAQA